MAEFPRRQFLQSTAVGILGVVSTGCLGSKPEPMYLMETHQSESATTVWSRNDTSPITTSLFTNSDELNQTVRFDVLPAEYAQEIRDVDFSEAFVTIFQTRLKLHAISKSQGSCPERRFEEGTIIYRVPLARWPQELEEENAVHIELDIWRNEQNTQVERVGFEITSVENQSSRVCDVPTES